MSNPHTAGHELASSISIEELDLALADLNLDDDLEMTAITETVEEVEEPAEVIEELEGLDEEDERAIAAMTVKEEVYGEQETTATMEDAPEPVEEPAKAVKAPKAPKAAKAASAAKTAKPKIERDLTALPAELFKLLETASPSDEAHKLTVISYRPTQKKIGEKFDNVFQALNAGRAPSVYIMDCFAALDAAPGKSLSSKDMIAVLCGTDKRTTSAKPGSSTTYVQGTASSQVGQIMALFPVLGVANRSGMILTLRGDSTIATHLRALAAA